jgi:hypothetical protein
MEPGPMEPPTERLDAIEHQAVIEPSSKAVHHKPVFKIVHNTRLKSKGTEISPGNINDPDLEMPIYFFSCK